MADSEVKVIISGDSSSAQTAMQQASQAVKDGVSGMKDALSGLSEAFSAVSESFVALGALFAGGAAFKEVIESTKEWTGESIALGRSLGIAAEQASIYMVAIEAVGGSADDFASASRGLTRQLKSNEKGLNNMGIATRDAHGDLLNFNTIMLSAIEAVNKYAEGTDRNLAAQTAFGRGASANSAILRFTAEGMAEAKKEAEELNLLVGPAAVQAFNDNRAATGAAMATLKGLAVTIGNALLPILTQLEQWFRDIGPAAITVTKVALALLLTPVWEVIKLFNELKDIGAAVFNTLATGFVGLAKAAYDAATGNFAKAKADIGGIGTAIAKEWKQAMDNIVADSKKADDQIRALWGESTASGPAKPKADKKWNNNKEDSGDDRLAKYKNERTEEAQAAGDFDQKDIQADLAFWKEKLAIVGDATEKDRKLQAEIGKIILEDKRKIHDAEIKEEQETIKTNESLALGELAAKQQALQQELAMGKITQAQELAGEVQLENAKYAIQKKALDDEIELMQADQAAQTKFRDQELLLEQKHAADVQKIVNKAAVEENKTWATLFSTMRSGFASTISGFLQGTTSLGGAVKGLFQDIGNSIIQMIANLAAQWLETSLMQLITSKTTGAGIVTGLASQAAAGAFAATAAIPYIGPELAPAAAAEAMAATLAFAPSAAGGYDIPAGVNPMTQLHQQEMVLPQKYANVIRGMANGQGGGGQTNYITAMDARSMYKALSRGGGNSPVAKSIKRLNKGFVR